MSTVSNLDQGKNWAPVTPTTSSPPTTRLDTPMYAFSSGSSPLAQHQQERHNRFTKDYRPRTSRQFKSTTSARTASTRTAMLSSSPPTLPPPRVPLESGSDWHSRFTLQCAHRARSERQKAVKEQRNGLAGDVVRTNYETKEEMAVWKRMAVRAKQRMELEADAVLEHEYQCMLQEAEDSALQAQDSDAGIDSAMNEDHPSNPDEEFEAYLAGLHVPQEDVANADTSMSGT